MSTILKQKVIVTDFGIKLTKSCIQKLETPINKKKGVLSLNHYGISVMTTLFFFGANGAMYEAGVG